MENDQFQLRYVRLEPREEGVGLWAYEPRTLAFKIDSLLDNPEKLASMQKRSKALARPDSCQVILEKLLGPRQKKEAAEGV